MLARNWAAGRSVRDAPSEFIEFALLNRLGGYTRETLDAEPAWVVRRWLMLLEAEANEQRVQAQALKNQSRRK